MFYVLFWSLLQFHVWIPSQTNFFQFFLCETWVSLIFPDHQRCGGQIQCYRCTQQCYLFSCQQLSHTCARTESSPWIHLRILCWFILFEFCLRNGSLVFFLDLYYFLWVCWKDKDFCYKFDVFETTGQVQVNGAFATVAYHCRLLSEVSVSGDKKVMTVNNVFRCETHSTIVSISLPYFVSATEVLY